MPALGSAGEGTSLQALTYVPDFVPEIIDLKARIPATVQAVASALRSMRPSSSSACFPRLFPADPQPAPAFAIFVAAAAWQDETVTILLDCLLYDGTLFAKAVDRRLSRESLLQVAGVPQDAYACVYPGEPDDGKNLRHLPKHKQRRFSLPCLARTPKT